ncbi:hypothetical protein [Prevotella multiformis]|nr:hypothetical protein [Prevotella multiformis]
MRTFLLCMIALFAQSVSMTAQVAGRIEFPYRADYEDQLVLPVGDKGLVVQSFAKDTKDGKRYFKTAYYSTAMKYVGADSMLIDKGMYYYSNVVENGVLYTVLREKDGSFMVVAFNAATRKCNVTDGEYTRKGSMRNLVITNGSVVFSSTQKKTDRIGIIDLKTGHCNFADIHFPKVKDKDIFILENTVIDNVIYALVRTGDDVQLVRVDKQGKVLGTDNLTADIAERIVSASVSKAGGRFFVTGTYSKVKKGGSEGIFFSELKNNRFNNIKFYNFLDLKNFTEYMSGRKQAKVERRKAKAEKAGKEYALDYLMASHRIMTDGKDYFYLGEAYYPVYRTTMVGNMVMSTFAGYAYTHAVLAKFNAAGNLLWDECFPMDPRTLPMYVKRFVSASMKGNNVNLLFADKNRLVSKLFRNADGKVIQDRTSEMIETGNDEEDVKKMRYSNSQYWYGDNFLVYGTQVVKNSKTGERRKVFAITKYTIR